MIDYEMNRDAIEKVKEINSKLNDECDEKNRTRLMFEQMLRGLYLNTIN